VKKKSGERKDVARYGRRGAYIRVVLEKGGKQHRVLWKNERGERKTESFAGDAKGRSLAVAFAEGLNDARTSPPKLELASITLRDMWQKYLVSEDHWREKTVKTNSNRWNQFELFAGPYYPAEKVTLEMLDEFRREMKKRGIVQNQIRQHIAIVKVTFRWAMHRDLIPPSKIPTYRFRNSKDEAVIEQKEFSLEDGARVLSQFDPRSSRQWRPYALVTIAAQQGPRENALLHLTWDDVDFENALVTWRRKWDKLGKERSQPMTEETVEALYIALGWRMWMKYEGPWVFPPVQARRAERGEPWTYAAAMKQLSDACATAGVKRAKYQGYHAFRRGAAGNVSDMTGNPQTGMHWIGDTDMRQSPRYLKTRSAQMQSVATQLSGQLNREVATQLQRETDSQTSSESDNAVSAETTGGSE